MIKDVLSDMLNESSKDMKYKKIFIEDIMPSKYNQYPICEIDELAQNIKENGLFHPIVVKEVEDEQYVIISGERRYTAIKKLYDEGNTDFDEIPCLIKIGKLSVRQEKRAIRASNAVRHLTKEEKIKITKEASEDYDFLKKSNEIPKGLGKREWIASNTGFSPRAVQTYLNAIKNESKPKKENDTRESWMIDLEQDMNKILSTRVMIKNKRITIDYEDESDLNRILNILGIED